MSENFSSLLAGFQGAAAKAKCDGSGSGRLRPPPDDYHLQLVRLKVESKSNDIGPFVQATLTLSIIDQGKLHGKEFTVFYLINLDEDGDLNYHGENFIFLAGILAGEPIGNNDPVTSATVVEQSCAKGDIIRSRVFQTKKNYNGIDPMSLETPIAETANAG